MYKKIALTLSICFAPQCFISGATTDAAPEAPKKRLSIFDKLDCYRDDKANADLRKTFGLLEEYIALPDGPKSAELQKQIEILQSKAAVECAQSIVPSKDDFRMDFEAKFKGELILSDLQPISIKVLSSYQNEKFFLSDVPIKCAISKKNNSDKDKHCIQLEYTILLNSLCNLIGGLAFIDQDILIAELTHSIAHAVNFDQLCQVLCQHGLYTQKDLYQCDNSQEIISIQEVIADEYTNNFSHSSCIGNIKHFALLHTLTNEYGSLYPTNMPPLRKRLKTALFYAKNKWKTTEESLINYQKQGIELAHTIIACNNARIQANTRPRSKSF